MELVLTQTKTISKVVAKQAVVALSVAVAYFLLAKMNPLAGLTGAASLAAFANIRVANVLRALVIVSPGAAIGVAAGAHAFNISTGKVLLGAYPIMPIIAAGVGLFTYTLSQKWGRSVGKDLALIALYGWIMGVVVTLHLTSIAAFVDDKTLKIFFTGAAQWKILTHTIVPMLGYPLLKLVEGKISENRSTK
jgi:hypothetical protein